MSAGTSSPPVAAGNSAPATFQELVTAVAEQVKSPAADRDWKIAGFNIGNLWAVVLLAVAYVGPKIDEAHNKVMTALDAIPQIRAAAQEMAQSSKLTAELLVEMRAENKRRDEKIDALLNSKAD